MSMGKDMFGLADGEKKERKKASSSGREMDWSERKPIPNYEMTEDKRGYILDDKGSIKRTEPSEEETTEQVESQNEPKVEENATETTPNVAPTGYGTAENTPNDAISAEINVNNLADDKANNYPQGSVTQPYITPTEDTEEYATDANGNIINTKPGASADDAPVDTPTTEVATQDDEVANTGDAYADKDAQLASTPSDEVVGGADGTYLDKDKQLATPTQYISNNANVQALQDWGVVTPEDKAALDEYMSGAPEATSKEEEERIIRGKQTAEGIAALGNVLAALANVFAVGNGAISQQIPELKGIDYEALRDKYRQGRDLLAKYKAGARQYIENMRIKREELEIKKQRAQAYADYQSAHIKYKEALEKAAENKSQLDIDRLNLLKQQLEDRRNHWQAMEGIAQTRANTDAYKATTSRLNYNYKVSGDGKSVKIDTPSGTYQISKDNISANRGRLMEVLGMKDNLIFRAKTNNEIDKYIMENWNDDCTRVLENVATRVETPTVEQSQSTPTRSAPSSASQSATPESSQSGTSNNQGNNASSSNGWGNSINRKKKK